MCIVYKFGNTAIFSQLTKSQVKKLTNLYELRTIQQIFSFFFSKVLNFEFKKYVKISFYTKNSILRKITSIF